MHTNSFILRTLFACLVCINQASANEKAPFGELYFEGAHLDRVSTNSGFLYGKLGYSKDSLQWGIVTRIGADTRTASDPSNAIYNDNYLFTGAGVSYLNAIPGVKLIAEVGYSFDLSKKINRAGVDFRTGWLSYHEILMSEYYVVAEFYSEGLYVHRYRDFLLDFQPRLFFNLFQPAKTISVGPMLSLNFSFDTANEDYNRFLEFNYGVKGKWFLNSSSNGSGYSLGAQIYGVRGFRTNQNTELPAYSDFRFLLFGYFSFI